jgi:hypothetical protein
MKSISFIHEKPVIKRILKHLNIWVSERPPGRVSPAEDKEILYEFFDGEGPRLRRAICHGTLRREVSGLGCGEVGLFSVSVGGLCLQVLPGADL